MNTTAAVVLTYRRPASLAALVKQLRRHRLDIHVYDDEPVTRGRSRRRPDGVFRYTIADHNHGRDEFWCWVSRVMQDLERSRYRRFVFLPDDVSICHDFGARCEQRWTRLPKGSASLNLLVDDRAGGPNWTARAPVRFDGLSDETWWVDGCFYSDRTLFDAIDWKILPIKRRPDAPGQPPRGSGVWAQVSRRLVQGGHRMFRSHQSLVLHHGAESQMNPAARQSAPLRTQRWIDG